MPSVYDTIREAIAAKKSIRCIYSGHERYISPHVIGSKNGRPQFLGFQYAGTSSKGLPEGGEWRCIPVMGLADVTLVDDWHTGLGHSKDQTCVSDVDLEIKY